MRSLPGFDLTQLLNMVTPEKLLDELTFLNAALLEYVVYTPHAWTDVDPPDKDQYAVLVFDGITRKIQLLVSLLLSFYSSSVLNIKINSQKQLLILLPYYPTNLLNILLGTWDK